MRSPRGEGSELHVVSREYDAPRRHERQGGYWLKSAGRGPARRAVARTLDRGQRSAPYASRLSGCGKRQRTMRTQTACRATHKRADLIKGATGDWEVVIGLEVHAQVASKAKLFSGASTAFGGEPNSHVSLVDAAMPGMLPVINEACIAQAVRTGLGLKAQINLVSVFDRKNYFYPDLPQGYQISQYKQPIVGEGEVEVDVDGETLQGRHRAAAPGAGRRQVDPRPAPGILLRRSQPLGRGADGDRLQARHALGQAGAGLRLASCAPSCATSAPATATWRRATCAPTSTSRCGEPGEQSSARAARSRTSTRSASSARPSRYEARRQIDILEDGGSIEQETRLFDPDKGETRSMRSKEEAHDYRYFPDPDLLPLELTQAYVDGLKKDLPELPDAKTAALHRATTAFGLRRRRAGRRARERRLLRGGAPKGARRQDRRQLGDQRAVRPPEQGGPGDRAQARSRPDAARRHHRPHRLRRHLRQDRQGRVRDRLERGRRPRRDRREARA